MSTAASVVLGHLLEARHHAVCALEQLASGEEYLRDELVDHLARINILLDKMAREDALIRDRDFLHADLSAAGIGEWLGDDDGDD